MTTTRDEILRTLLQRGQATVKELSESVNVSQMAVRHHLAALQAEGLVALADARVDNSNRRAGRPNRFYTLTTAGQEQFPHRYVDLSDRLLDGMKSHLPADMIEDIFDRMALSRAQQLLPQFAGKPLEEKLRLLVELLGTEGFAAKWNRADDHYQITEHNCPYMVIGQRHPEVCNYDRTLISTILELPIVRHECVLHGGDKCVFLVPA